MTSSDPVKGSWNCGSITVSIKPGSFPTTCTVCHCLNCRASGGTLFVYQTLPPISNWHCRTVTFSVNLPILLKDVEVQGQAKVYPNTDSSAKVWAGISMGTADRSSLLQGVVGLELISQPTDLSSRFWRSTLKKLTLRRICSSGGCESAQTCCGNMVEEAQGLWNRRSRMSSILIDV